MSIQVGILGGHLSGYFGWAFRWVFRWVFEWTLWVDILGEHLGVGILRENLGESLSGYFGLAIAIAIDVITTGTTTTVLKDFSLVN